MLACVYACLWVRVRLYCDCVEFVCVSGHDCMVIVCLHVCMHVCVCVCLCCGCVVFMCDFGNIYIVIVFVCLCVCMFVNVCACIVIALCLYVPVFMFA